MTKCNINYRRSFIVAIISDLYVFCLHTGKEQADETKNGIVEVELEFNFLNLFGSFILFLFTYKFFHKIILYKIQKIQKVDVNNIHI